MIHIAANALGYKASQLSRESGVDHDTVLRVMRGANVLSNNRDKVVSVLANAYHERRPLQPPTLDKLVWEILFPYVPFNDPTPGRGRSKRLSDRVLQGTLYNPPTPKPAETSAKGESCSQFNKATTEEVPGTTTASMAIVSMPLQHLIPASKITQNIRKSASPINQPGDSVPWDCSHLSSKEYAVQIAKYLAALNPLPQRLVAEFKADLAKQLWALKWSKDSREYKALASLGVKFRNKKIDPEVADRKRIILEAVGPAIAWLRKHSTHSKGAYDTRTFGFRRQMIEEAIELPDVCRALANPQTGELPSVDYIEKTMRENGWFVDPRNEPEDFVQRTIGWRPKFGGDVILADWTGLPIKVDGAAFEIVNRKTGKKETKYKKFGTHLAVDAATNYTWLDLTYGDNEQASWPRFLEWLLFTGLGYAPNWLVMDKVSGVVMSLCTGTPNDPYPKVMPEVMAWVAAGTRLCVHTPERANAKGHVEVAAKLIKHRELSQLLVRKCLAQHMRGTLSNPREVCSHSEVLSMLKQMAVNANKRVLNRDGIKLGAREDLWLNDAEDAAKRDALRFLPDARANWRETVSKAKHVWVSGKTIYLRANGVKHVAEISGFEEAGVGKIEQASAWIVPPLPRIGVDPEEYRVCLIQSPEKGGIPRFYSLTARASKKDKYAFDEMRPHMGEGFRSISETQQDKTKRAIDMASKKWAGDVRALKTGTHDEPINPQA